MFVVAIKPLRAMFYNRAKIKDKIQTYEKQKI